ncbi:hypothetical protein MNBD_GAMMA01-1297 [hydrothermal vent metagenome]|uniref:HTH cro/C1-type domain-containing protein n=1 Tax=hydrothermal vent metagenome TaxID=652676 RepID=A0A3B0VF33_9ZZZZ
MSGITKETIRALRDRLELSQEEFAMKISVSPQTISRWERGVSRPHRMFIRKIIELENESI